MNSATVLAGTSGCTTSKTDGIAVGRRAQHRRHADVSAGTDLVLDEDLLAQAFRQILSDDARHGVVWAAGSKRHDPMNRSRGIALRPCDARDGRQRGSDTYQMQKLTAGKFHGLLFANRGSPPSGLPRGCCTIDRDQ